MPILKNRMAERFSQLPNELIEDCRISARAFRIAAYLFSRPTGWEVHNPQIMKALNIKDPGSLAKYWQELIAAGWLTRERKRDEAGVYNGGYDYQLHISPLLGENPNQEKTLIRKKPYSGKNPDTYNNTDLINKTDFSNKRERGPAPTITDQDILDFQEQEEENAIFVEVEEWPPTPNSARPPSPGLPPEEMRIREAIENCHNFFSQYPAMFEQCREASGDPATGKKEVATELESWVRYHGNEFHFLSSIRKHIPSSFMRWMQQSKNFNKKINGTHNGSNNSRKQSEIWSDEQLREAYAELKREGYC
jgi:hypothetical protein